MNATTQANNHFNLHVSGVGYINRIRWVDVNSGGRRAKPFLACSISAMRGDPEELNYTYFDCKVVGEEAQELCERLIEDVEQRRKVVVSFKLGDIYPHLYDRDVRDAQGRKTGKKEKACLIKGRLLLINSITIDGERVYERPSEDASGEPQDTATPPESPATGEKGREYGDEGHFDEEDYQQPRQPQAPQQRAAQPVAQTPRAQQATRPSFYGARQGSRQSIQA